MATSTINMRDSYIWNVGELNTTDTWIPVFNSKEINHRVIPSNADAVATKTNTTAWTDGTIYFYRRGNCCTCKVSKQTHPKITTRTTIGTIPEGFRPPCEVEVRGFTVTSDGVIKVPTVLILQPNGNIAIDPCPAGSIYMTMSYAV